MSTKNYKQYGQLVLLGVLALVLYVSTVANMQKIKDWITRASTLTLNQMWVYDATQGALVNQFVLTEQPGNPPSQCVDTFRNPDHPSNGTYSMEVDLNHFCTSIFTKQNDATFNASDYTNIEFDMKGVLPLFTTFNVSLNDTHYSSIGTDFIIGGQSSTYQITNSWQHVVIPLTSFNIPDNTQISGMSFRSDDNPQTFLGHVLFSNVQFVQRPDVTPPTVVSMYNSDLSHLAVSFSERINSTDAITTANYVVKTSASGDPYSGNGLNPTGASLASTQKDVSLTLPYPMTNGRAYQLVVNNIHDLAQPPNVIASNTTVNFTAVIQSVTFNVDANQGPNGGAIRAFSPLLRGSNAALWEHTWGKPFMGQIPVMEELSKQAKIGLVRYAGGNWANAVTWVPGDGNPSAIEYTSAMMDSVNDYKNYTGSQLLIQTDICNNNPSMWANMLNYTNVQHNYNFKYWEIGSENNYDACTGGITPAQIASRYLSYRSALLAVDPTIIAVSPATAGFAGDAENPGASDDWFWPLISQAHNSGRNLDALSWHWYQSNEGNAPIGCGLEYGASPTTLFNYNTALTNCYGFQPGDVITDDHNFIMQYRRKYPEIGLNWAKTLFLAPNNSLSTLNGITEINTLSGLGTGGPSALEGNHVAALWFADMLGRMAYAGYDFNTMYNLYDQTNYSLIYPIDDVSPTDIRIRPTYYSMLMYGKYFGDRIVQSSTSDSSQKVTVFAAKNSQDPTQLTLMVTNLTQFSYNATINIANYTPVNGNYYELTNPTPLDLSSTSSTNGSGEALNGATINTTSVANVQSSINAIPARSLGTVGGQFTHAFPAYTATVIVLSNTGAPPPPTPTGSPAPSLPLTPTPTVDPRRADINHDLKVNVVDFNMLKNQMGTRCSSSTNCADINCDGVVTTVDQSILKTYYGQSFASTAPACPYFSLTPTAPPPTLSPTPAQPTPTSGASNTVTFNDYPSSPPPSGDYPLTGQYPTGIITWGTNWITTDPTGGFTTRNFTFSGSTTSSTFTFINPKKLVSIKATNPYGATVTFSCSGQPTATFNLPAQSNGFTNLVTNWTGSCTTVTVTSSNGNATNFDDLVYQ